jgi:hypothetical protein
MCVRLYVGMSCVCVCVCVNMPQSTHLGRDGTICIYVGLLIAARCGFDTLRMARAELFALRLHLFLKECTSTISVPLTSRAGSRPVSEERIASTFS